jgi:hypothetical protein
MADNISMAGHEQNIRTIFQKLDARMVELARERIEEGLPPLRKAKIILLGQMSLNKFLIRESIASGKFGALVDRILENGGNLEDFV